MSGLPQQGESADDFDGQTMSSTGNSIPSLPQFSAPRSDDFSGSVAAAGDKVLAEMEERVKEKQNVVQSKTNELQELEERLAAAERRKAELEAKGLKI